MTPVRKLGGYVVWAAWLVIAIPAMQQRDFLAVTRFFHHTIVEGIMTVALWYVVIFAMLFFVFELVPTWFDDQRDPDRET